MDVQVYQEVCVGRPQKRGMGLPLESKGAGIEGGIRQAGYVGNLTRTLAVMANLASFHMCVRIVGGEPPKVSLPQCGWGR